MSALYEGGRIVLQHFTFQPVFSKKRRKNYRFSFFHQGTYYRGLYHYNGTIEWDEPDPLEEDRGSLESQIHELMLFHVYDK